ncbi:hypothetical protein PRIPAC_76071 [Pristionchus pacificus]|uniref:Uncharacterized protein n=1 Tax=Pristionchus pacificus TaxID=54126 RepID=A0A2A6BGG8_PRIPA|nr:hypothetical protein PRIPAC_76071 [Pristionchus pacificus]|eukprot:PDM64946.1 hypothetical protein PRIPAC_53202 [Pristionchus pacificus]
MPGVNIGEPAMEKSCFSILSLSYQIFLRILYTVPLYPLLYSPISLTPANMLLEAEAVEERIVSDRDYQYDDIRCCEPRVLSFYLPRPFARIIVRNRLDEARTGPLFTNPFVRINWSYDWAFVYPCSSKIFSAIKLPLNMGNSVSAEERQEFQMVEKPRRSRNNARNKEYPSQSISATDEPDEPASGQLDTSRSLPCSLMPAPLTASFNIFARIFAWKTHA